MVRIENLVSRTIFENRNVLKSRAARGASNLFSQTFLFENDDSAGAARVRREAVAVGPYQNAPPTECALAVKAPGRSNTRRTGCPAFRHGHRRPRQKHSGTQT